MALVINQMTFYKPVVFFQHHVVENAEVIRNLEEFVSFTAWSHDVSYFEYLQDSYLQKQL